MLLLRFLLFLLFCCIVAGLSSDIGAQTIWNETHQDRLRHDLLLNYDKFSRPMQHYNKTTLKIGMTITHVEFLEFKSTLSVHGWMKLVWNDEKLKWNESNYENLSVIRLAEHEVWQPDIYLYNSAVSISVNQYGNTYSLVYPNGDVLWVPPVQLSVLCQLNLKHWPYDTQECYMVFGSWTHNGSQIELQLYNDQQSTELEVIVQSEWKILKTAQSLHSKKYPCCPDELYPYMMVNLTLSRISSSYKTVLFTPALVVVVLTLWSFWLPPQASEKIVLNSCTAVIVTIFLLYFTQKLPLMGNDTPKIVLFYTHFMFIVGYSMCESGFVISLSRVEQSSPLPWIIKKPLTGILGKLLGLGSYIKQTATLSHRITEEELRDQQGNNIESSSDDNYMKSHLSQKATFQHDWILLAAAVDRIFFIIFTFIFVIWFFDF